MAEERDILQINLKIQGIGKPPYSFAIERGNEQTEMLYRQAEKQVNELMAHWSSNFKGDAVDCLAMTALTIAMNSISERMNSTMDAQIAELETIDRILEEQLNKL